MSLIFVPFLQIKYLYAFNIFVYDFQSMKDFVEVAVMVTVSMLLMVKQTNSMFVMVKQTNSMLVMVKQTNSRDNREKKAQIIVAVETPIVQKRLGSRLTSRKGS